MTLAMPLRPSHRAILCSLACVATWSCAGEVVPQSTVTPSDARPIEDAFGQQRPADATVSGAESGVLIFASDAATPDAAANTTSEASANVQGDAHGDVQGDVQGNIPGDTSNDACADTLPDAFEGLKLCDSLRCTPTVVAKNLALPIDVAVNDEHVYWIEFGPQYQGLKAASCASKYSTCFSASPPGRLDIMADSRFLLESLALAADDVCWIDTTNTSARCVVESFLTGAIRTVAQDLPYATNLVAHGANLLWLKCRPIRNNDGHCCAHRQHGDDRNAVAHSVDCESTTSDERCSGQYYLFLVRIGRGRRRNFRRSLGFHGRQRASFAREQSPISSAPSPNAATTCTGQIFGGTDRTRTQRRDFAERNAGEWPKSAHRSRDRFSYARLLGQLGFAAQLP